MSGNRSGKFVSTLAVGPQVAKAIEDIRVARLAQAPASHLVRGVLYADAGLFDDAEREMAELEAQNPGSEMVRRFVDQLAQLRQRNGSRIRR